MRPGIARLRWSPGARDDLLNLYRWIAGSVDADVAFAYTSAIEERCGLLRDHPQLGAIREDLGKDVRTLSHRRRTLIVYCVSDGEVVILAIGHNGRQVAALND